MAAVLPDELLPLGSTSAAKDGTEPEELEPRPEVVEDGPDLNEFKVGVGKSIPEAGRTFVHQKLA